MALAETVPAPVSAGGPPLGGSHARARTTAGLIRFSLGRLCSADSFAMTSRHRPRRSAAGWVLVRPGPRGWQPFAPPRPSRQVAFGQIERGCDSVHPLIDEATRAAVAHDAHALQFGELTAADVRRARRSMRREGFVPVRRRAVARWRRGSSQTLRTTASARRPRARCMPDVLRHGSSRRVAAR